MMNDWLIWFFTFDWVSVLIVFLFVVVLSIRLYLKFRTDPVIAKAADQLNTERPNPLRETNKSLIDMMSPNMRDKLNGRRIESDSITDTELSTRQAIDKLHDEK
jgi:hypothetical protein